MKYYNKLNIKKNLLLNITTNWLNQFVLFSFLFNTECSGKKVPDFGVMLPKKNYIWSYTYVQMITRNDGFSSR